MIKRTNMYVMEGWRLISCLDNSAISLWLWSVAHRISVVSSTVENPNLFLPRIRAWYKLSKSALSDQIKGRECFSLRNLDTTEYWSLHPHELEASSWSHSMNPVPCVQDFTLCLRGPSKFLLGVGSCHSWVLPPVHGESQTSLNGTICLEWTIWVWVCQHTCLEWSVPR